MLLLSVTVARVRLNRRLRVGECLLYIFGYCCPLWLVLEGNRVRDRRARDAMGPQDIAEIVCSGGGKATKCERLDFRSFGVYRERRVSRIMLHGLARLKIGETGFQIDRGGWF